VPVLLVTGDRDERVILRIADTLAARLPDVRRVTIPGAGHAPNLERPERFNEAVLDFLRRPRAER
jgi:3-oxoadipate enol-lactonase